MKRVLFSLFFITALMFSCKNEEKQAEVEQPQEDDYVVVQGEVKPGEMYHEITYYRSGSVKMEGNKIDDKREGRWMSFFENGNPWSETHFQNGLKHGPTTVWFPHGIKYYEGQYENDRSVGTWKFFNEDGEFIKEENF
jgi:antitoxin component YwqK of YwqJK toxin-antitoxin module